MANRKRIKKRNILIVLLLIICVYVSIITIFFKEKQKYYGYVKDGKGYRSEYCYEQNQLTYCKENGVFISVDSYYITD